MVAVIYPNTLPAPSLWGGQPFDRAARSPLLGNAQLRGRSHDAMQDIAAAWVYSPAEMAAWVAWYGATLLDGMRWFAMSAPGAGGFIARVLKFRTNSVRREALGAGHFRVSANLQQRGISAPPALGIELDAVTNAGLTSAVGVTVSVLNPATVYAVSVGGSAVSMFPSDATPALSNHVWQHGFRITSAGGTQIVTSNLAETGFSSAGVTQYLTAAAAFAAFPAGVTITGYGTYTFWFYDFAPSDNRGGPLSIVLTPV